MCQRLNQALQRKPLRELLDEVETFALGEYATALLKGATLPDAERAQIVRRLAAYTGLTAEYIERSNLRIQDHRFVKELLRTSQRTVGRLDSRFTGIDRDSVGESTEQDPSLAAIIGPYTAALYQYVRADLGFESDLPYEVLTGRMHTWSYAQHENRYVDVADTLRMALATNEINYSRRLQPADGGVGGRSFGPSPTTTCIFRSPAIMLRMVVTTEITRPPQKAGQKPSISKRKPKLVAICAVSMSSMALITNPKKPSVRITNGQVRIVNMGRNARLTRPKIMAIRPSSQPGPTNVIPGTN